jgi:hypothetical protein
MTDFTKLANFLNSFSKDDANYDAACYIRRKIAEDLNDRDTVNNGESDDLQDNEITMSTPDQQTGANIEGALMSPAFKELDALNQLDEEKEEIELIDKQEPSTNKNLLAATADAFGDNAQNRKEASLFSMLQQKFKK